MYMVILFYSYDGFAHELCMQGMVTRLTSKRYRD